MTHEHTPAHTLPLLEPMAHEHQLQAEHCLPLHEQHPAHEHAHVHGEHCNHFPEPERAGPAHNITLKPGHHHCGPDCGEHHSAHTHHIEHKQSACCPDCQTSAATHHEHNHRHTPQHNHAVTQSEHHHKHEHTKTPPHPESVHGHTIAIKDVEHRCSADCPHHDATVPHKSTGGLPEQSLPLPHVQQKEAPLTPDTLHEPIPSPTTTPEPTPHKTPVVVKQAKSPTPMTCTPQIDESNVTFDNTPTRVPYKTPNTTVQSQPALPLSEIVTPLTQPNIQLNTSIVNPEKDLPPLQPNAPNAAPIPVEHFAAVHDTGTQPLTTAQPSADQLLPTMPSETILAPEPPLHTSPALQEHTPADVHAHTAALYPEHTPLNSSDLQSQESTPPSLNSLARTLLHTIDRGTADTIWRELAPYVTTSRATVGVSEAEPNHTPAALAYIRQILGLLEQRGFTAIAETLRANMQHISYQAYDMFILQLLELIHHGSTPEMQTGTSTPHTYTSRLQHLWQKLGGLVLRPTLQKHSPPQHLLLQS